MPSNSELLNLPGPEPKPESVFYSPPEFASTPPASVEYRIRPVDAAKTQRGWNANHRKESSFISFGREPPVDLPVSHDSVSRKHVVLQYGSGESGPGWYLYDLASSHGTFLNNEKIPSKEYILVEDNVPIRLGFANKFEFALVSSHVVDKQDCESKTAYKPPNWRLKVPEELDYCLEVISNGSIEKTTSLKELLLDGTFTTVGSRSETAIIVDNSPSVSRLHAVLQFGRLGKKYGWFLYDNASTHGIKLNRARLHPKTYAKLPIGGSFVLGGSKKLYCLTGVEQEAEDEFAAKTFSGNKAASADAVSQKDASKEYEADPIGWLTSHFESEGLQVEYSFVPSGETTICSIDVGCVLQQTSSEDTDTVARAEGKGRDEAKRNAALLACRMIDLQENDRKTSEFRTKRQEYEENDFYSSDEDEFLDRTGSLEVKRKQRKARYQETQETEVLTHENLCKQLTEAEARLENVKQSHERIMKESGASKSLSNKFYVSASRQRVSKAQAEVERLKPLVAATRPTNVDHYFEKQIDQSKVQTDVTTAVKATPRNAESIDTACQADYKIKVAAVAVITEIDDLVVATTPGEKKKEAPKRVADTPLEMDTAVPSVEKQAPEDPKKKQNIPEGYGLVHRKELQALKNKDLLAKKRRIAVDEEAYFKEDPAEKRDSAVEIKAAPEDEAVWLPPEDGQTGDGRTKLNDKFAGRY